MSEEKHRGRPKEPNARNKRVDIRLTSEELNRIDTMAKRYSTTRTGVIMQGIKCLEDDLDA